MMRSIFWRVSLGFLLLAFSSLVFAQPPYPKEFPSEFSQVKGCTMAQAMNMGDNITAMLTCGELPMQDAYDFYLAKAKEAGWSILMENKGADFLMFMANKGETAFQVTAAKDNGETQLGLSLVSKTQ